MKLKVIRFCLILAVCWIFCLLGAEESTPPDSLQNKNGINLRGDLQQIMQGNQVLSRMYPLLFRKEDAEVKISEKIEDFEPYRGKIIARINIIPQDVFTMPKGTKAIKLYGGFVRLGNALHPKTRERLIRKQLFFTEGDSLNPAYLISNLQYLYEQALFSEIQFGIVDLGDDEIELSVFTREKFFLRFSGGYVSKDKFNIQMVDRNLFGTGHSLENTCYVDTKAEDTIGWESSFINSNIMGSFFQGNLHWLDVPGQDLLELKVQRPFIYPLFRYSGGGEFAQSSIYPPQDSVAVKKAEAGAWIARNFYLFDYPRYSYAALSLERDWYYKRPSSNMETGMPWQESFFALGALGFTKSSYRYMPRVSSFMDNDYLPVGYLFEIYGGADLGEYINRPFSGLSGSFSIFPTDDQFLYFKYAIESFWTEGKIEEGVFALEPMYISQTANMGKVKARSFVNARYIRSLRSLATQSLSLKSNPAYRGSKDLSGTDLIYASMEEDLSLPVVLLGFQLTTFALVDMAIMTDDRLETDKRRSLFSQGIGVRFRNPSLIWDFIELFFSIDQGLKSKPGFSVKLRLNSPVDLDGFKGRRPHKYDFQ